ncbi:MAG: rod shape-determining protein RodA [Acidimicrobiia bacterium]|nr:rod shape-determining protein RodA [Acidimicrobiia bacterium]
MATDFAGLPSRSLSGLDRRFRDPRFHIDWVLLVSVLGVLGFGLLNVYAAKHQAQIDSDLDVYAYVKKQSLAIVAGMVAAVLVCLVDYRHWRDYALVLYFGTAALLLGLFVVGRRTNGAQAWYPVGGFDFQPAEVAKVTLVLVLAAYISSLPEEIEFRHFVTALAIGLLPAGLVLAQPDLGTAMVMGAIVMAMLLVGGASTRHIAVMTLLLVTLVALVLSTGALKDYQRARLTGFVNRSATPTKVVGPASEYEKSLKGVQAQLDNTITAIAHGGITGTGFLKGTQTNGRFVPEQHTDFIFSAAAEQFGLVGAGGLLLCYVVMGVRIWRIATLSRDRLGTLIAVGALAMLVFHVFENIGMNLGIMPVTGIPLPFMSYGGSSTMAFLILMGLVENVHMRRFA